MATNKLCLLGLVLSLTATTAWCREAASASACQSAASQPAIANARTALDREPDDLRANFGLADAWSDAGCFNEAVQVLEGAQESHPTSKELDTRLRVAKSLVGEERYFDNLDRANADAKLRRQTFRCTSLADLEACNDALRMKPDDVPLVIAQGDALLHAKRPADALARYRLAAALSPHSDDLTAKIGAAESQLPPGQALVAANHATLSAGAPGSAPAKGKKPTKAPAKIRVARVSPGEEPVRRYTNAAADDRSH